ncbi:Zinc finger FYVE domain-containing 26 [Heracleum sosnowskyi]|uniref:Zinc finger FYVE domain-containing 26 n=1 Tax=Heracleum sosnowskyi TaxID=360622 RepID=A0AAD8LYI5_9APIA|nr:Zinc finger FYVE domain-containing 26 [Heracleum sosnowskyi]
MFRFYTCFCIFSSSLICDVFGLLKNYISRLWAAVDERKSNSVVFSQSVDDHDDDDDDNDESLRKYVSDEYVQKGFSEFSFEFKKFDQDFQETECSVSSVSKYQVMSSRDVSGFVQVPETMSFSVEESFEGFIETDFTRRNENFVEEDFEGLRRGESDEFIDLKVSNFRNDQQFISQVEFVHQDQGKDCSEKEGLKEEEGLHSGINELPQNLVEEVKGSLLEETVDSREIIGTKNSSSFDENSTFNKFNFDDDEFIELEPHLHHSVDDLIKEIPDGDVHDSQSLNGLENSDERCSEERTSADEDLRDNKCDKEFETQSLNGLENSEERCLEERASPVGDLHDNKCDDEFETQSLNGIENSEERCSEERTSMEWESDEEDEEEDFLMEHKYLIEQMKMEAKHARTGGLPTILEEAETTKIPDDLKPLQIDETFDHSDRMEEIQKFYKSYSDKMRKMDILNRQTMHAISFIQLKEPVKLISSHKSAVSAMKSMFLMNFNQGKLRKIYADQTLKKSMIDMRRDLERVYVGQVCISWEILHWQYTKAQELQEHDSQDCYTYNQVAGEFQQFQVLLHRFLEDELFEGPRVQNYVSKRMAILSLLQVPIIKNDRLKNKIVGEYDAISIAVLKEIIEESMRVFWEFLRADKHEDTFVLKQYHGTNLDHQDAAAHLELLMDIKSKLQKKEKRLKEILRSGGVEISFKSFTYVKVHYRSAIMVSI